MTLRASHSKKRTPRVMPKAAMMDAGLEWLFELLKTRLGGA